MRSANKLHHTQDLHNVQSWLSNSHCQNFLCSKRTAILLKPRFAKRSYSHLPTNLRGVRFCKFVARWSAPHFSNTRTMRQTKCLITPSPKEGGRARLHTEINLLENEKINSRSAHTFAWCGGLAFKFAWQSYLCIKLKVALSEPHCASHSCSAWQRVDAETNSMCLLPNGQHQT